MISFLFKTECYSIVHVNHIFTGYLSVGGYLGSFPFLAIVNAATMNTDEQTSPYHVYSFGYSPGSGVMAGFMSA